MTASVSQLLQNLPHITRIPAGRRIDHPGPLFSKLGPEWAEAQSQRFGSACAQAHRYVQ
jgi:hypothetical protein